jgi:hypothetical protein
MKKNYIQAKSRIDNIGCGVEVKKKTRLIIMQRSDTHANSRIYNVG